MELAVSDREFPLQIVREGLAIMEIVGVAVTFRATVEEEGAQGGLEIVHCKVVLPGCNPLTAVVGEVGLAMLTPAHPLTHVHIPVPTAGVFPLTVVEAVGFAHRFWTAPALATVGGWFTVSVTVCVPEHPAVVPVIV